MNTPSRPTGAGRLRRTSAFAVTLAGVVAVGVAVPATSASAAVPTPVASAAIPAVPAAPTPATGVPAPSPVPVPGASTTAPRGLPPLPSGNPGERNAPGSPARERPVQPRGGVDTGAGGSQPDVQSGADIAVPLAAGGAGLGTLAGFGLWRRRRAGALG